MSSPSKGKETRDTIPTKIAFAHPTLFDFPGFAGNTHSPKVDQVISKVVRGGDHASLIEHNRTVQVTVIRK